MDRSHSMDDTIAAVATPPGAGGVAIVRLSGPSAIEIVSTLSGRAKGDFEDRKLHYGKVAENSERVDEALFVVMRSPHSFTGEDVAEIHSHGGTANVGRVLGACLRLGARSAGPGEFSRRAFSNGRMDLTQAEALVNIVNASSEKALRHAQAQHEGALSVQVAEISTGILAILAETEARIDFPEDGLQKEEIARLKASAQELANRCDTLAKSYGQGRALHAGISVALKGPVNAGKSSLFNALLGRDRALVSPEAGTTRDFVESDTVWEGVRITLVDTAGEREAQGQVEEAGIALGSARADEADLVLLVSPEPSEAEVPTDLLRTLLVHSKCDAGVQNADSATGNWIATSVHSRQGIETLRSAILQRVCGEASDGAEGLVVSTERQRRRFASARDALLAACGLFEADAPGELTVIELQSAYQALAEIAGRVVDEDMLDELFARFCIGK